MNHFFTGLVCAAILFMPPVGYSLDVPIWAAFALWALMGAGLCIWARFVRVSQRTEIGVVARRARRYFILIAVVAVHIFGASRSAALLPFPVAQVVMLLFALLLYGMVVFVIEHREAAMAKKVVQPGALFFGVARGFLTPAAPFFAAWGFLALLDTFPLLGETVWTYRSLLYPGLVVVAGGFAALMPYLALLAIPSTRLRGTMAEHLLKIAEAVGVPIKAIYMMRTGPDSIPNASVAGLFGRLRFVFVSEGLMHCPLDEVEAVFAHELGHARLNHPLLFLIYGFGFLGAVVWLVVRLWEVGPALEAATGISSALWGALFALALVAVFLVGFGWISRRLEQTADAYAANLVGPETYSSSLMRIWLAAGGLRKLFSHWRHFPLPQRIETVSSIRSEPETLKRIVRANTMAILLLFAMTLAGLLLYLGVAIEDATLPGWEVAARRAEYAQLSGRWEEALSRVRKALKKWPDSERLKGVLRSIEEQRYAPDGHR